MEYTKHGTGVVKEIKESTDPSVNLHQILKRLYATRTREIV